MGKSRENSGPINDFPDILAWQEGRKLKRQIYQITKAMPQEERFVLASQMRRAAISVTANIAEGYGRYHFQENIQFCRHSRGSLCELQDHLATCLDVGYLTREEYQELYDLTANALRLLNGYIGFLQKQKAQAERGQNQNQQETKKDES